MEFDEKWLRDEGFCEPVNISQLMGENSEDFFKGLESGGIYIVLNDIKEKGEDIFDREKIKYSLDSKYDSYDIKALKEKWNEIKNHYILYIGKAKVSKKRLRDRIKEYLEFGKIATKAKEQSGKISNKIRHGGGKAIWQLKGCKNLKICWKECPEPEKEESKLLKGFIVRYGDLPFANMKYEKYISGNQNENS
jgi:hypothetical protein